jgi:hypothetical protein
MPRAEITTGRTRRRRPVPAQPAVAGMAAS